MLEFIVLGRIPGTQLRLSFTDILLISALLIVVYAAVYETKRIEALKAQAKLILIQITLRLNTWA